MAKGRTMSSACFEPHEYCTKQRDGRPISRKRARIKYTKLLQKSIVIARQQAYRFGIAQIIVTCVAIVIGVRTHNTDITMVINGVSAPFLFSESYQMFKAVGSCKMLLKQVERHEIDPYKELRRIEKGFREKPSKERQNSAQQSVHSAPPRTTPVSAAPSR